VKEFTYTRNGDDVFVNCPLNFSEVEMKIYQQIIRIKGNNGSYPDVQFLSAREKTGIYSRCVCFLENDHISLKFCRFDVYKDADPSMDDIQANYDHYRYQLLVLINEVLRLQEMIKLIPDNMLKE